MTANSNGVNCSEMADSVDVSKYCWLGCLYCFKPVLILYCLNGFDVDGLVQGLDDLQWLVGLWCEACSGCRGAAFLVFSTNQEQQDGGLQFLR